MASIHPHIHPSIRIFSSASSEESWSPKKYARRLLKCLLHPENERCSTFWVDHQFELNTDEVYEQLRIQSDSFASIFSLLPDYDNPFNCMPQPLSVLCHCATSSVSANLLAKEERVWKFLIAALEDDDSSIGICADSDFVECGIRSIHTIRHLVPYVNEITWKFAVRCGLLELLLAGMQKKPLTCNSVGILDLIDAVLSRPITQAESIETLVKGGLFPLLEQLIQKSGHLLKPTPPCLDCSATREDVEDFSRFSMFFLQVQYNILNINQTNYPTEVHRFVVFFFL